MSKLMSCCIKRLIEFSEPMCYHTISILDVAMVDYANECMYSWSTDGVCWNDWQSYDSYNLICPYLESDFFLRIVIGRELSNIKFDGVICTCYNISIFSECQFDKDLCSSNNLLNPYMGLDCAMQMYMQTSDSLICIFGTPIYYFKVGPVKSTADYTFKEYVLHEVQTVKQLKMIFPGDSMPSSKPVMNEFDFDWENDWDVEISKKHFANAFGDEVRPAERDFLYCPLTQKMYYVNGAWQERENGFMYQAATWKLALRKWEDDTALSKGMFDIPIDELVGIKYDEIFHEPESIEQERESGISQFEEPKHAGNTLYNIYTGDAIRKKIAKDNIEIIESPVWHKSVQIAYNFYKFFGTGVAVTYQKKFCGDSGTMILLANTENVSSFNGEIAKIGNIKLTSNIVECACKGETQINSNICFADKSIKLTEGNNIIVLSWSRSSMTVDLAVMPIVLPYSNVPKYKIKPQMYQVQFNGTHETKIYDMEYECKTPQEITLYASPLSIGYFKVFDTYMIKEEYVKEALKYGTTSEHCILNDVARPFEGSFGFEVK